MTPPLIESARYGTLAVRWGRQGARIIENPLGKVGRLERAALAQASEDAGQLLYRPTSRTTGLLPGTRLTDLQSFGNGDPISLGTGLHTGRIFWGEANPSRIQGQGSRVSNCAFAGPAPENYANFNGGFIRLTGQSQDAEQWLVEDSFFSALLWTMPELNPPGGARSLQDVLFMCRNSIGLRGHRGTLRNCEITEIQDGVHVNSAFPDGAADDGFLSIEDNWIHKMLFYRGAGHSQPEGTHSDVIQFHIGRNVTIKRNYLGGPSDPVGYNANPGYNSGDGAKNAVIMLQQEISNSDTYRLENVQIHDNIIHADNPDGPGLNWYYGTNTDRRHPFSTSLVTRNHFVQRPNGGVHIYRHPIFADKIVDNDVIVLHTNDDGWDVIGPVPQNSGG